MIGKRLRDVIMLDYAVYAFDDCCKLSINILYVCSKSSKKLDFIGNVYDNNYKVFIGRWVPINTKRNVTMTTYIHTTQSLTHKSTLSFFSR